MESEGEAESSRVALRSFKCTCPLTVMSDPLSEFELVNLVSKITKEIVNHTGTCAMLMRIRAGIKLLGISDKAVAEFTLAVHDQCQSVGDFKAQLKDAGAGFSDSFVENLDRIIMTMHPKRKKSSSGTAPGDLSDQRRTFSALNIPDQPVDAMDVDSDDLGPRGEDELTAKLDGMYRRGRPTSAELMDGDGSHTGSTAIRGRSRSPLSHGAQAQNHSRVRRDSPDRNGRDKARAADNQPVL